jgi:hypothetical protein
MSPVLWYSNAIVKKQMQNFVILCCVVAGLCVAPSARAAAPTNEDVAEAFAPVFYQGLGDKPRYDYITRFDFDGDWKGDNNWENADSQKASFLPYIYYAVSETQTHYFIHYAVFHPRDVKGGDKKGALLSELLREGAKAGGKYDPTGLLDEAVLAHENDMEGCLVVVAKDGANLDEARVVFVETLSHNRFLKFAPVESDNKDFAKFTQQGQFVRLFIEPKGHGIEALREENRKEGRKLLPYALGQKATSPTRENEDGAAYELLPLSTTLWPRAQKGVGETFGEVKDYGTFKIQVPAANGKTATRSLKVGSIGAAFNGKEGMPNAARPPWGWFDAADKGQPAGFWFFTPAETVKRHFKLDDKFSLVYLRHPLLLETAKTK